MNRAVWLLPPLALGIGIAAILIATARGPERIDLAEQATAVRLIVAENSSIRPMVRGYGTVRPSQTWTAVAELRGTILWRHPDLASGNLIAEGTELLHIDPEDYDLAIAEAEAERARLLAERALLDAEADNTAGLLALERERLSLSEQDLARTQRLVSQGSAPQARLDEQTRATLLFRRTVRELENSLALIPARRDQLTALIGGTEARLMRARRERAQAVIRAPFDLRLGEVRVERHEYVVPGQTLLTADGIAQAEVTAQMPFDSFRRLPEAMVGLSGLSPLELMRVADLSAIDAEVRLADGGTSWPARIDRVEAGLDPRTRTVQVVVVVDDPYGQAAQLPLVRNMYVQVTLLGPELPPAVILPDAAVHEGDTVYLMGADGRLEIRPVTVAFRQNGLTILADGLAGSERIVADDLVPAMAGMLLREVAEARP